MKIVMRVVPAFVLLLVTSSASAQSATSGVRDNAKFFSSPAIDEVAQPIRDIKDRFAKDLLIETFVSVPDEMKASFDPNDKDAFFSNWATERARAAGVNGVYVLICRDP